MTGYAGLGLADRLIARLDTALPAMVAMGLTVGVVLGGGPMLSGDGMEPEGLPRVVGATLGLMDQVLPGIDLSAEITRESVPDSML